MFSVKGQVVNIFCFADHKGLCWKDSTSALQLKSSQGQNVNRWGGLCSKWGFPGGSDGKESACNAGDFDLIPGLGRSPGGRNGNPLQCSCLENPMDRGVWSATVHEVAKSFKETSFMDLEVLIAIDFHVS